MNSAWAASNWHQLWRSSAQFQLEKYHETIKRAMIADLYEPECNLAKISEPIVRDRAKGKAKEILFPIYNEETKKLRMLEKEKTERHKIAEKVARQQRKDGRKRKSVEFLEESSVYSSAPDFDSQKEEEYTKRIDELESVIDELRRELNVTKAALKIERRRIEAVKSELAEAQKRNVRVVRMPVSSVDVNRERIEEKARKNQESGIRVQIKQPTGLELAYASKRAIESVIDNMRRCCGNVDVNAFLVQESREKLKGTYQARLFSEGMEKRLTREHLQKIMIDVLEREMMSIDDDDESQKEMPEGRDYEQEQKERNGGES